MDGDGVHGREGRVERGEGLCGRATGWECMIAEGRMHVMALFESGFKSGQVTQIDPSQWIW
jgi:hypothetical protein